MIAYIISLQISADLRSLESTLQTARGSLDLQQTASVLQCLCCQQVLALSQQAAASARHPCFLAQSAETHTRLTFGIQLQFLKTTIIISVTLPNK